MYSTLSVKEVNRYEPATLGRAAPICVREVYETKYIVSYALCVSEVYETKYIVSYALCVSEVYETKYIVSYTMCVRETDEGVCIARCNRTHPTAILHTP